MDDLKEMSSELFDLASSVEQLGPINNGVLYPNYREVSCQKSIEGASFPSGQQVFRFNVSGTTWWCPEKTYMSFRVALTDEKKQTLPTGTDIGPNMGLIANLYSSIELRMGGKVVQRISQFMPQIDSLLHRTTKSDAWLNSIGESTNFWNVDFDTRKAEINDPALTANGYGVREMIWRPCLPLFHMFKGCLPSGDYEIVLNPKSSSDYKRQVFESGEALAVPGVNCDFEVQRVQLKVATVEGPRVDSKQYAISLNHIECQSSKLLGSGGLSQQYFSVSPATKALCVAYQDNRLTNGEVSASKYVISSLSDPQDQIPSFRRGADYLSRLYLQYDGLKRPEIDATPRFDRSGALKTLQVQERYYQSLTETGMIFNDAGAESLEVWQQRGPYYFFNWNRSTNSGATRVQVNQEFSQPESVTNGNVLLFSISETSAIVTVRNGDITSVEQVDR